MRRLAAKLRAVRQFRHRGDLVPQPVDDQLRKVDTPILRTPRGEARKEQSGADPDLQHSLRLKFQNSGDGGITPLLHVAQGNRPAVIAAVPAVEVLAERSR